MGAWVENAGVEINDLLASATVYQRHLTKKLNMLQDKQFLRYHLFQNWSNVLSLGALSITAIRTACCRPGSRRIVVTILLRQLSSSCTTISSAQSTVASSFLSTCSTWARPDTVDHECLIISPSASVLGRLDGDAMTWFRFYLTDTTQTFVVGEDTHSTLPVNCSVPQGSVSGRLSSFHTQRMCQNSSPITETVIICLLTTSNAILPFLRTRFMSVVNAWCPASVICRNGVPPGGYS